MMLMSIAPGAILSIIADRVVYEPAVTILGRSALQIPGFAIPFSASYLVGVLTGFLVVVAKELFFCLVPWVVVSHPTLRAGAIQPSWLAKTSAFLKRKNRGRGLFWLPFYVAALFFQYLGLAGIYVSLGVISASIADLLVHSWRNSTEN